MGNIKVVRTLIGEKGGIDARHLFAEGILAIACYPVNLVLAILSESLKAAVGPSSVYTGNLIEQCFFLLN